jgi:hypothetical protein
MQLIWERYINKRKKLSADLRQCGNAPKINIGINIICEQFYYELTDKYNNIIIVAN